MTTPSFPTIATAPITQVFGNYNPNTYGGDGRHKGIDYGVLVGNPVYACLDGVVSVATMTPTGYGRHVRISHADGSLSIYGHLSKTLVSVGSQVRAGQEIGKSGGDPTDGIDGDGLSTGPHLHFEIRPPGKTGSDQYAVDPENWLLENYMPGTYKVAEVTATSGLNVRLAPSMNGIRLRSLMRKETILIETIEAGWAKIRSLRPEWCSAEWLSLTGEVVEIRIKPADPSTPPTLPDAEKLARLWDAHPELH